MSGTSARRLRARLSNEQYEAAIEVHRRGFLMRMTGELSREVNLYWLYNARDIELVHLSDIIGSVPEDRRAQLQLPFEPESEPDESDFS